MDSNSVLPDEAYEFDANGNRELVDNVFGADQDFVVDPNNRIASDGTYTYQFDDEGNRTQRWVTNDPGDRTYYTWDHRNRLTRVSKWNGDHQVLIVDYDYDAFNQLISVVTDRPFEDGVSSTVFVHDGGQVVLEFGASFEFEEPEDLAPGDLSHRFVWGPVVDQLLADEQVVNLEAAGEVLWVMADHLGSVRDVVDSNGDLRIHRQVDTFGNIVDEVHYDTDGEIVVSGPGYVTEAFAFTGRWRDPVTGLQNNLFRWYDSATGGWISEDPLPLPFSDENPHRYVNNQPVTSTDPTGLLPPGQGGQGRKFPPKERGQQFEEIERDQRLNRRRNRPEKIRSIEKSRQRDKLEVEGAAEDALEKERIRRRIEGLEHQLEENRQRLEEANKRLAEVNKRLRELEIEKDKLWQEYQNAINSINAQICAIALQQGINDANFTTQVTLVTVIHVQVGVWATSVALAPLTGGTSLVGLAY